MKRKNLWTKRTGKKAVSCLLLSALLLSGCGAKDPATAGEGGAASGNADAGAAAPTESGQEIGRAHV